MKKVTVGLELMAQRADGSWSARVFGESERSVVPPWLAPVDAMAGSEWIVRVDAADRRRVVAFERPLGSAASAPQRVRARPTPASRPPQEARSRQAHPAGAGRLRPGVVALAYIRFSANPRESDWCLSGKERPCVVVEDRGVQLVVRPLYTTDGLHARQGATVVRQWYRAGLAKPSVFGPVDHLIDRRDVGQIIGRLHADDAAVVAA